MNLSQFKQLPIEKIRQQLLQCCHCDSWAEKILQEIENVDTLPGLYGLAESSWNDMGETEYLEAFAAHPRIGDMQVLKDKFATQAHSEQGQVAEADEKILIALMQKNDVYYEKFGFIFIICATGKSAQHMLSSLEQRLANTRDDELEHAAEEQRKIMLLRLAKIFEGSQT